MDFAALNEQILPPDEAAMACGRARWDNLAKPVGSLGELEGYLVRAAGLLGTERVAFYKRAVLVFCADNGVTAQGVAATPASITATMARIIAQGRSAVGLFAKRAGADVFAVDMGMFTRVSEPNLRDCRIAAGTRDMTEGPAMTREQAARAIETGMELVREKRAAGYGLLATGEMGIGNTTSAAAVAAALLGLTAAETTGRGAGLTDEGLRLKTLAVERALFVNRPDPADALDVLFKVGGFDIAAMAGAFLGGALYRVPILIDGVISAAAALVAMRLCPRACACMLPSHLSAEPAAARVFAALGLEPPVRAGLRLGEGTGAALMFPILDMALAAYDGLLTFAGIGM